jgi:hypothetical protein
LAQACYPNSQDESIASTSAIYTKGKESTVGQFQMIAYQKKSDSFSFFSGIFQGAGGR